MKLGYIITCIIVVMTGLLVGWLFRCCSDSVGDDEEKSSALSEKSGVQRLIAIKPVEGEGIVAKMPVAMDEKHEVSPGVSALDDAADNQMEIAMEEVGAEDALSNPDLSPAVMDELREVFSQVALTELTNSHPIQLMLCYKPSAILGAAGVIMKCGTDEEKKNALYAIGVFFGEEGCTGIPFVMTHPKDMVKGDGGQAAPASSQTDTGGDVASAAVIQPQALTSIVLSGLFDADEGVRDAAFDVMRSLPREEADILAANLLSEGDIGIQERLMREAGECDDCIRLSLMGMGSESHEVRNLAAENLKNALGVEFSSQMEASEWYEEHFMDFSQSAEKKTP